MNAQPYQYASGSGSKYFAAI